MKHLFSFFCVLIMLSSCNDVAENNMLVTGEVKGLRKGTILLKKIEDTAIVVVDSVVANGSSLFQFSEELKSPEVFYLSLKFNDSVTREQELVFFGERGSIQISTNLDDFEQNAHITGSVNQEKWEEYKKLMDRYNSKNLDFIEELLNAMKDGNDSITQEVQIKQNKLFSSKYLATVNYAMNNKDYEIAPFLMVTEVGDANIKYLDTIYNSLTPKIKDSKYGKVMESLISDRKK